LYRRVAELVSLEIQLLAVAIAIDAVADTVGIAMNNTAGTAANGRTLGAGVTGVLCHTWQGQQPGEH